MLCGARNVKVIHMGIVMSIDGIQIKTENLKDSLQTTHGQCASQHEHVKYNHG